MFDSHTNRVLETTALVGLLFVLLSVHLSHAQQSSVQVEKIEMFPVEPRPGESVKIRCYLKNVDPSKKIKPSILWSIKELNGQSWRIIGNGASITDTFNNRLSGRKESDEVSGRDVLKTSNMKIKKKIIRFRSTRLYFGQSKKPTPARLNVK